MSCIQITTCGSHVKVKDIYPFRGLPASRLCIVPTSAINLLATYPKMKPKMSRYQICNPTCLFGDKGKSKNDNEPSSWKSLEKAMGGLRKEPSMQDLLREQQRRQELGDSGGGSGSPPGGGGGDGSGGTEDEGMAGVLDELLQVVLATLGFVFMYVYILEGEELTRLAKDYIKYLFTKNKSVRLRRAMYKWKRFYQHLTRKNVAQSDWLERAIINTPTWWHDPQKMRRLIASGDYHY